MKQDRTETGSTRATQRPNKKSNGSMPLPIPVSIDKLIEIRLECLRIISYRASEREMGSPEEIAEKCFQWVIQDALAIKDVG
jgi:hypothetical protein